MTYKELLNLYKKGELSDQQKKAIKADIEKQEAISEFLFENDDIPELRDSCLEAEIPDDNRDFDEKHFQKMIKKSIRKAFLKLGITVGVIVLALVIVANTALPNIVDAMYYDPAEIVGRTESGAVTSRLDIDMMVYSELFTPGYYRNQSLAIREGFGKYEIQIFKNFSFTGQFNNVYGTIDKNRLTLFDDTILNLPAHNAFWYEGVEGLTGMGGTGAAGSPEDALRKLNELDEHDHYVAYVTFDKVMTYNELVAWSNKNNVIPDWFSICEQKHPGGTYPYFVSGITGFNFLGNASEHAYDNEKYPYLNFFDVIESADDYHLNKASSKVMQTHVASMLRYMLENKDFYDMVGYHSSDEHMINLLNSVEEHGIFSYGFVVTAQKDKILEISNKENVSYIYTTPLV